MLFNLIQPSGWTVGIVRVEDVAIGFAVSLAVGLFSPSCGSSGHFRAGSRAAYAAD